MYTLLLRLGAPLQAWGSSDSKFNLRRTQTEPTKSGVIGLLASAMGRSREESVEDLAGLRFGVRVDQPGQVTKDLQTVNTPWGENYLTYRYYIQDAVFLAGMECRDAGFLEHIGKHLLCPSHPLYLGRKACPPTMPVFLGIRDEGLESALTHEPWLANPWMRGKLDDNLRILVEPLKNRSGCMTVQDVPVSFDKRNMVQGAYRYRFIKDAGTVPAIIRD